ncbi:MAG: hypothetical protein LBI86_00670 [Treponema sp.]|jgi:hypothetical protein|nr:hypothetical protein [Treponema sp.]
MASRSFLPALFLLAAVLAAQQNTEKSYFIDDSSGTPRFVQRISWYPEEYALYYEVYVEDSVSRREILREKTGADHLDMSLPPGIYRYRVRSYDLLGKPSEDPPWEQFEVLPALKPELFSFDPAVIRPEPEKGPAASAFPKSLTLRGHNLENGARVTLRNRENGMETDGILFSRSEGNTGEAVFSSWPGAGTYDVTVENPGGLSVSLGPVTLLRPPRFRAGYFSAGYGPLFPIHGQFNTMLAGRLYPLGFFARFGFMPLKVNNFSFGFESAAGWNYLSSDYFSGVRDYRVTGHFANLKVHAAARMSLAEGRAVFALYGGGGLAAMLNFRKWSPEAPVPAVNALFPAGSAGFQAAWHFSQDWFAVLGLEYLYLFSADETNPGFLLPFAGAGLRF